VHDRSRDLAPLTTLRLGGPATRLVTATDTEEIPPLVRELNPGLVLAGGSNVVVADEGYPGTVLLVRTRGVDARGDRDVITLTVAAGEPWDEVVARTVAEGWAGVECLSGIPGTAGATPIQNVGAYGQDMTGGTVTSVRAYDRERDEVRVLAAEECGFGYRSSVFRHSARYVVLEVTYRLHRSGLSTPVRYAELARTLGVDIGGRAPLAEVREAVLKLRTGKGMVLDPSDPDTRSAGSFFTNPVLDPVAYAAFADRIATLPVPAPAAWPDADGAVKLSAAWLIQHAGFARGYGRDGVSISGKHTLALTNRGTGTTAALLDLAREIVAGVHAIFGVTLRPEVMLVNCAI
jgi:UDP-N-acetylmuramate dehydrogenase